MTDSLTRGKNRSKSSTRPSQHQVQTKSSSASTPAGATPKTGTYPLLSSPLLSPLPFPFHSSSIPLPHTNPQSLHRKVAELFRNPHNTGDDIAGTIHAVGANVTTFRPGDRVAAFHEMMAPGGSYAEYAVAWHYMTSHIPESLSYEAASTIPLAGLTAVIGNYARLGLPEPPLDHQHTASTLPGTGEKKEEKKETKKMPFLVYGAATAVGAFAIKLARLSNIHPIIGVAGRGIPYATSLIDTSQGDVIIDYRTGNASVVSQIRAALARTNAGELYHAFDAVADAGSHENVVAVLAATGKVTYVMPLEYSAPKGFAYPASYQVAAFSNVGDAYGAERELGERWLRGLFGMVGQGRLGAHPFEVVPGGLGGVGGALGRLKEGKASAVKYVFRVGETEGAGRD